MLKLLLRLLVLEAAQDSRGLYSAPRWPFSISNPCRSCISVSARSHIKSEEKTVPAWRGSSGSTKLKASSLRERGGREEEEEAEAEIGGGSGGRRRLWGSTEEDDDRPC